VAQDMRGRHPWPIDGNIVSGTPAIAQALQANITPHLLNQTGRQPE